MFFLLWKSEDASRARDYDCEYCVGKKLVDKRKCLRYDETVEVKVPTFKNGRKVDEHLEQVNPERVLEILTELSSDPVLGVKPVFYLLMGFVGVCPMGVVWNQKDWLDLATWEGACERYGMSPISEALMDWPAVLHQAFEVVTEVKNVYQQDRMERLGQANKTGRSAQ